MNILNRVITRGLVMSGRKANLTIALEDKPGQLKKVAEIVSRCGSNVVSVQHDGSDPNMPISSCFLKLTLETRDADQIEHDLQGIAPEWGIGEKSLRKLSAIVLGRRVSKAQRLSNWEAATLTDKQQLYAATDAWVCTRIYEQLLRTPKKPIRK